MKFTKRHNLPDYNCDIHSSVSYGNDVNIDSSGSIKIGKNTHLAHNVKIFTHNHVIMPQCNYIDDWAVVGAFSVVTKDIGRGEIWAGNPAKKIKNRGEIL